MWSPVFAIILLVSGGLAVKLEPPLQCSILHAQVIILSPRAIALLKHSPTMPEAQAELQKASKHPLELTDDSFQADLTSPGKYKVWIIQPDVMRLSDKASFHLSQVLVRDLTVTQEDISGGTVALSLGPVQLFRAVLLDASGHPMPRKMLTLLGNQPGSTSLTTNARGQAFFFATPNHYRLHSTAKNATVKVESLTPTARDTRASR
jgi:hypothetical protein